MRNILNKFLMFLSLFVIIIALSNKVSAESFTVNKKSVTIGENFTTTISGINGKVTVSANDKISLSNSGTMWVTGSVTISGTAKSVGTGNITIKLIDATTTGANPKDLSGTSKSISITVKPKEEPKQPTQTQNPTTQKPTQSQTTKKPTTTTIKKPTTTNKQTEIKKEEIVQTQEKEEATPLWGISDVKLIGVKGNEEKVNIELDKKFDINTYEYSCNVDSSIKKIEIQKEAYEYNQFITITGLEENLKPGENIITLKLKKEGQNELTYTFKVNKEIETVITSSDVVEDNNKAVITMPIWSFILLEIAIVICTITSTFLITKVILNKKEITKE